MSLATGTMLGPYEVLSPIGAGGMGEVYRATDTNLHRDVALKILPEAFASDADRVARFKREALVLATLNHPNIATIYGLEANALVMELVEGDDLSSILAAKRGAEGLPLDDAVSLARQIADALEAAHEHGVVHRDLKPQNVKVTSDGTVKVLDFGLAKAMDSAPVPGTADAMNSPTTMARATELNVILGTAAYMSPEQAKGKAVDKRADIWAFGVVVFEMLTGTRLFDADTVTETLAQVMMGEIDLTRLPGSTPVRLRDLVARCLERDPKKRLRDIGEARILLSEPLEHKRAEVTRSSGARRYFALIAVGGLVVATLAAGAVWRFKPETTVPLRIFDLPGAVATAPAVRVSPDGTRIAYVVNGHLFVRAFNAVDPRDLGLVVLGNQQVLFWSPNSETIGFMAEASIRTIPATGGSQFVVCKVPASGQALGAAWRADGSIVFAVWRDHLYTVPATGGTATVALAVDPATEIDFHAVGALPDGRLIIQTHLRSDKFQWEIFDGHSRRVLTTDSTIESIRYAPSDRLLVLREGPNAGLWAVPFTSGPIDLSGAALIEPSVHAFDVADDRTLVCDLAAPRYSSLIWVDRTGAVTPVAGAPVSLEPGSLSLSPDGLRAAFLVNANPTATYGKANLVVRDLATGADTQLTFDQLGDATSAGALQWFPQGDRLLIAAGKVTSVRLLVYRADVASAPRELLKSAAAAVLSVDGRTIVFATDERGRYHLQRAPITPDGSVGAAAPVFQSGGDPDIVWFSLSPDGQLIAYAARQDSGHLAVFVAALADTAGRLLVVDGGNQPQFSSDGRELFYIKGSIDDRGQPKGVLMVTPVTRLPSLKLGVATPLFDDSAPNAPDLFGYNVAPDGHRFLLSRAVGAATDASRMIVVQNWPALIGGR